jgi:glycosyltransferase involved in cell wall biosynthesis
MSDGAGRKRPLRLAVVAPRLSPAIVGGSESYLWRLCAGLAARGVQIEVVTTRSERVLHEGADAVRWESGAEAATASPRLSVVRFAPHPTGAGQRRRWRRRVGEAWARAVARAPAPGGQPHLSVGFHELEQNSEGRLFRWTGARAAFELGDAADSLALELHPAHAVELRALQGGHERLRVALAAERWQLVEVPLARSGGSRVELAFTPPLDPPGDPRELGVALGGAWRVTGRRRDEIPLGRDDLSILEALPEPDVARLLDRRGRQMPWRAGWAEARLKGPWSAAMLAAGCAAARRADVVLATNAPYATLAYGWIAARLADRPLATMPFLHLRDAQHHRPQVRAPLARSTEVLCLGEGEAAFVRGELGAPAVVLGAGVDAAELDSPRTSAARFRTAYGLGADPLIVQVGRKTPAKGYRMSVEAVERLRREGLAARLVLVGPDEDGQPLASSGVLALGEVDRQVVLDALAACDVFVLPSLHESFGLAYLEAWMACKPVVGHAGCAAAASLVRPGEDGELVSSADELAAVLRRLLADPAARARLGARGRERAAARTWDGVVDRAANALERLARGSVRSTGHAAAD